jgi:putative oxidoreductase
MSTFSSHASHLDRPNSSAPVTPHASLLERLLGTHDDLGASIARIALGVVIFPHGAQKLLGWFGGYGFSGTMGFFTHSGIPAFFAFLAIVAEFFGSIGLIVGGLSRVAAFGVGVVMAVAMFTVHLPNGFFMNWFGNQKGEGFEYMILAIGLALVVMVRGGGKFSLDRWLSGALARRG